MKSCHVQGALQVHQSKRLSCQENLLLSELFLAFGIRYLRRVMLWKLFLNRKQTKTSQSSTRALPGGPVVKTAPVNAGIKVWSLVREIPHATGQPRPGARLLSLQSTAQAGQPLTPMRLEPVPCSERSYHHEEPEPEPETNPRPRQLEKSPRDNEDPVQPKIHEQTKT